MQGVFITMMLGSLLGLLIGVPYVWAKGKGAVIGTYLPLGVFLAMGGAVAHMWGDLLLQWYLQVVGVA